MTMLSKVKYFILDSLFPIRCISCGKENYWICEKCFSLIQHLDQQNCPVCKITITPDGRTCPTCKRKNDLDGLIAAANYNNTLTSKAIHFFKYRFIDELHVPLGKLIVKAILNTEIPLPDIIIPVPLHPRRLRWRGFNQSALLAKIISTNLSELFDIKLETEILSRKRYTKPQMEISNRKDRHKNIFGAFDLQNKEIIKDKIIFLIDDVTTTGFTIFECAKVLKEAGAREVYAAIVAKQENR